MGSLWKRCPSSPATLQLTFPCRAGEMGRERDVCLFQGLSLPTSSLALFCNITAHGISPSCHCLAFFILALGSSSDTLRKAFPGGAADKNPAEQLSPPQPLRSACSRTQEPQLLSPVPQPLKAVGLEPVICTREVT